MSLNYKPSHGVIVVGIVRARHLKAKDINGQSGEASSVFFFFFSLILFFFLRFVFFLSFFSFFFSLVLSFCLHVCVFFVKNGFSYFYFIFLSSLTFVFNLFF